MSQTPLSCEFMLSDGDAADNASIADRVDDGSLTRIDTEDF